MIGSFSPQIINVGDFMETSFSEIISASFNPNSVDMNAIFTNKNGLDVGLSCQLNSAVGAIVGYDFGSRFYVGYSYTYPLSNLSRVAIQSHEVALRYKFNNNASRCQGPRFFN